MVSAAEKIIGPGLYLRGQVDYDSIDAANFSTIKHFGDSARHYRYRLRNPKPETIGQLKGTADHTAVLEPHKLFTEYALFEGKVRRGKKWDECKGANAGKRIIKQSELEQALAIRDAVRSDHVAMKYLEHGHAEVTLVWADRETGILCKARLDWVSDEHVIVDLKGTANASQWTFGAEAYRRQYHVQQAFYLDGYETLFPTTQPQSKILAVEYTPPHDSVVFNLPDEVLGIGRDAYRGYLNRLAECREAKAWPGRASGTEMDLMLPKYAWPDDGGLEELGLEME